MSRIIVPETEVWDYFQEHMESLKTQMYTIAQSDECGIEICLGEDVGLPSIVVISDNVPILEETAINERDCEEIVSKVYDDYLTSKVFSALLGETETVTKTEDDIDDIVAEREEEITCLCWDFIMGLVDDAYIDGVDMDEVIDDCKEHFLMYMARKHGIPIYRPMVIEYNDGTEEVEDYPYEHMEFEDEDNPIYK